MRAVITVLGKDMVGILAKVSAKCAEVDVNVIEVTQSILQDFSPLVKSRTQNFFPPGAPEWREIPPICTKCCKVSGNVGFVSIFAGSLIFKLVQFDVFPPFLVDEVRLVC